MVTQTFCQSECCIDDRQRPCEPCSWIFLVMNSYKSFLVTTNDTLNAPNARNVPTILDCSARFSNHLQTSNSDIKDWTIFLVWGKKTDLTMAVSCFCTAVVSFIKPFNAFLTSLISASWEKLTRIRHKFNRMSRGLGSKRGEGRVDGETVAFLGHFSSATFGSCLSRPGQGYKVLSGTAY